MHLYEILNWFVRFRSFFCDRRASSAGFSMMQWLGCGIGRGLQLNRIVCTQQDPKERRLRLMRGV